MDVETIARKCMDAAVNPELWGDALESIARYGKATGAILLPVDGRTPNIPHTASLKDAHEAYFREGWFQRDERERGLPAMQRKGVFVDHDFATPEEMAKSDYYRGFLARFDSNWGAGLGLGDGKGNIDWCLVSLRGDRGGPFEMAEQRQLLQLTAPVQQALQVAKHLSFGKAVGLQDAFDLLGCPSILLDRFGKVFRCNRSAEPYFTDGLSMVGGQLNCTLGHENARLRAMIGGLCDSADGEPFKAPSSTVVTRRSGRPLVIQGVVPRGIAADLFGPARILLFAIDPFAVRPPPPMAEFSLMFGLTPAETELLRLLEADVPLPQAAEQLRISYETARTHVKSILHRTDTRRQSDLLALVRRLSLRIG